jgi:hypothetical protein
MLVAKLTGPERLGTFLAARARWLLAEAGVCGKFVFFRLAPPFAFLCIIALWVAAYLEQGLRATVDFSGFEGDGPFQSFNPLRRIDAGQSGGRDFQYFHGIGFPYLHYPVFALAGKDVFAAELSRHLVNLTCFFGSTLVICLALARRWLPALALASLALLLGEQIPIYYLATVGNASSGVRSAAPLFALAVLLAGFRPRREAILVGAVAGIGILTGVEHGLAAVPMLIVTWIGRRWIGHPGGRLQWAFLTACALSMVAGGALLAIGGPNGLVAALRYSLVELPSDQFWYFGAPPNNFLFQWKAVLSDRRLLMQALIPLFVVAALTVHQFRARAEERPVAVILLGFIVYGLLTLVAYLGYTSSHYLEPAVRVVLIAGLVLAWRFWLSLEARGPDGESLRGTIKFLFIAIVSAGVLAGSSPYQRTSIFQATETLRAIRSHAADIRDGRCRMRDDVEHELDELVRAIDADRAASGVVRPPVIWSTYAGRLEAHYGVFNPACDYTIHALGPARREHYAATFRAMQPDYVVTCRRSQYSFEEWLRNSTWDFYEEIVLNYLPMTSQKRFVVWHRKREPWRTADFDRGRVSREPESPDWFTVPALSDTSPDAPRIVEVEYRIDNPLSSIPVVGGLPRYLLGPAGCANTTPISLPPYRSNWSFPVFPIRGQTPTFYAGTFSLVGGKVTILRVHVRPMPATPDQIAALRN